jgi:hypothetical protein
MTLGAGLQVVFDDLCFKPVVFEQSTDEVGAPGFSIQVRGSTLELEFDVVSSLRSVIRAFILLKW